ncbi:unnamed protein product [Pipistrellus nathusii]|uniref:Uncharacterized protein n=1 Tax=Pipistrellus nathusii TaxID=59473 RepID=A0ABP0A614_PIPNA
MWPTDPVAFSVSVPSSPKDIVIILLVLLNDLILFKKIYFIDFLQRGRERNRELETFMRNIDQLPPAHPPLEMCPQPRYMPLTGIEPGTFQSTDQCSIHRLWQE